MYNLRRFPAPWVMEEDKDCFRVKDASGFSLCCIVHRQDLDDRPYQYADEFLTRDEARRIEGDLSAAGAAEASPILMSTEIVRPAAELPGQRKIENM